MKRSVALNELWKHYGAKENGVGAFGYYSAANERIWMKSGAL